MTELINYIICCTVDTLKNNVSLKDLLAMNECDMNYILTKEINQKIVGDVAINMDGSNKELFVLDELSESD